MAASSHLLPIRLTRRVLKKALPIWLDQGDNKLVENHQDALKQLRNEIDDLRLFTNLNNCIALLEKIQVKKVLIIISGSLAQDVFIRIHCLAPVDSIFILSTARCEPQQWIQEYSKIKGVYTNFETLCEDFRRSIQRCNQNPMPVISAPLESNYSDININEMKPSFVYSELLTHALLDIDHDEKSRQDLITYCREVTSDNPVMQRRIDELERCYSSTNTIFWYTKFDFIVEMLNQSFQRLETDNIIKMRVFIRDLHRHIEQLHTQQTYYYNRQYVHVYHSHAMSTLDLQNLIKNTYGFISFNSFLTCYRDIYVAAAFSDSLATQVNQENILFVITLNSYITLVTFADISEFSHYPDEKKILFSTHTVFQITQIKAIDVRQRLTEVHLRLLEDYERPLGALINHFKRELQLFTGWERVAQTLMKIGQWNRADEIYTTLLEQAGSEEKKANHHDYLGYIKEQKSDYHEALRHHEMALSFRDRSHAKNHAALVLSYSHIGHVHSKLGEYTKALLFVEKALELHQQTLSQNDVHLALLYTHLGDIRSSMEEFENAIQLYGTALKIQQKILPVNHPDVAASYHNIGKMYGSMGEYDKSLWYLRETINIQQSVLPENHPDIAQSYHSIGLLYIKIKEYSKALHFMQVALNMQQHCWCPSHPTIQASLESIAMIQETLSVLSVT